MGAWGHDTFDNDTACDWTAELEESDDLSVIEETLAMVLELEDDYLDSDEATRALAACDTVARLRGNFGVRNSYTEPVDNWVQSHSNLNAAPLLPNAHRVIDRILADDSELVDLWKESDSYDEWLTTMDNLRSRLK